MLDEILNRTLSTHLEAKLADFYKKQNENRGRKRSESNMFQGLIDEQNEIIFSIETD